MRTFIVTDSITVVCKSYETGYSWGHKATLLVNGFESFSVKIRYYNRTWERFQYASILSKALDKDKTLNDKEVSDYVNNQV